MAQAKVTAPKKPTALGFGFQPELSEHFFLLTLPRSKGGGHRQHRLDPARARDGDPDDARGVSGGAGLAGGGPSINCVVIVRPP